MRLGKEKHSFDVALDHSLTHTAVALRASDKLSIMVLAFRYHHDERYVAYSLKANSDGSYTIQDDLICDRAGLLKWIVEHTEVKTIKGAQGLLHRLIWLADTDNSLLWPITRKAG